MPKGKKKIRLKLVSIRLQPETLVTIDVLVANKNLAEPDTDKTKYLRQIIEDHVRNAERQEAVKNFRQNYPEKYLIILEKYAKGV